MIERLSSNLSMFAGAQMLHNHSLAQFGREGDISNADACSNVQEASS